MVRKLNDFVRAYLLRFACDPRELLVASRFPVGRRGLPSIIITAPPGVARGANYENYHLVSCMFKAMVLILHLWHELLVPSCTMFRSMNLKIFNFFFFFLSILLRSQSGDYPLKYLAKFGYKPNMKLNI
jgi:hypothetical protein